MCLLQMLVVILYYLMRASIKRGINLYKHSPWCLDNLHKLNNADLNQ